MTIAKETADLLAKLGVAKDALSGGDLVVRSPVTGEQIAALKSISPADADRPSLAAWCRSRSARSRLRVSAKCRR
mgnify:CR=1 FL=1